MIQLALNIICIAVLGGVLWYAFRLDKRLQQIDKNKAEMEQFVLHFSAAISRAERAIKELKETATDSGAEVDRAAQRAVTLRDELTFLIDAADKIATRLTDQTSHAQAEARNKRQPEPAEEKKTVIVPPQKPVITPPPKAEERKAPEPVSTQPQAEKMFPTWLKKAPENRTVVPVPQPAESKKPLQSEAERDLQQALEKMR